jgi:small conductance mechanosensitive channel
VLIGATSAGSGTAVGPTGYLYDLLRRIGLTDFGARTVQFLVDRPIRILLIVLVAFLAARIGARATDRFVRSVHKRSPLRLTSARSEQRNATMAGVLARLVRLVIAIVAGLLILGAVGVNLTPLLAGASVAGVAIGFGAQSLVRDMLAGLFIIGEDQYGVGDSIDLGLASGVVEDVSLRTTRVRSADGTVWFVPNGQVQRVGNGSMEYSRAVVDVPLPFGAPLDRATVAMREEADLFATEPAWAGRLLDRPDVWGVQTIDVTGPMVRLVVKTAPLANGPVARELRLRILDRLARDGLQPLRPEEPDSDGAPKTPPPTSDPTVTPSP